MKKISLKNLHLKEVEQLSREQLKNVLGGWTGGTGETDSGTETEDCANPCTRNGRPIKQVLDKCMTSTCLEGICVNENFKGTVILSCNVYC